MAEATKKQSTARSDVTNKAVGRQQPLGVTVVIALVIFSLASIFAFKQAPRSNPYAPPTLWEELFKPREHNAFMRLAVITGNLSDVFVVPGSDYIWAVGNNGLIIHSKDGGETWQQQTFPGGPTIKPTNSSQDASLFDRITPIPAAHAGHAPDHPPSKTIQQKIPGNVSNQALRIQPLPVEQKGGSIKQKKQQIEVPPEKTEQRTVIDSKKPEPVAKVSISEPPPDLEAVYFIDKKNGWIVGDKGSIFRTDNGGITWLKLSSKTTVRLQAVQFVDSKTGWVVGDNRTILKSTNGGESWDFQNHDTYASFSDLHFINSQIGFVVGDFKTILKTTNGGMNWEVKNSGDDTQLNAIAFADTNTGIAVGRDGTILKTRDGGETWSTKTDDTNGWHTAIDFSDTKTAVAVGRGGTLLKTRDAGETWTTKTRGTTNYLSAIAFSDSRTGIAVGYGGTILKTLDGGESWTTKTRGTDKLLSAIAFSDNKIGVAVGSGGTLLKTSDGGKRWTIKTSGTDKRLTAITFSDTNTGVAVGYDGTILKTLDDGENWATKTRGSKGWHIIAVAFSDTKTGVAVGRGGTILKTRDSGESWTNKTSNTNKLLSAIAFSDTNTGVAVGSAGTILKTHDSGETWTKKTRGTNEWLTAVIFSDTKIGVAVGGSGTILKTRDGGESWTTKTSGTNKRLFALAFSDTQTGVAVGEGGTILKTRDAGESWAAKISDTNEDLIGIAYSDTYTGIAVGSAGTILKTTDAGETWSPPKYRRYPALWYWAVCIFFLLFALGISIRRPGEQQATTETVADILASDRPIQPGDPDPLNFGAIARGLSRFMRNPGTEPPLTVAITGAWGSGKSSLMNLLYYDLKQYGFTPVWFNAWHHQKGEQLLASLYANIRSQAVPGWFNFSGITPVGLLFRLNLFFRRSSKHRLLTSLLIALPIAAFTHLIVHPAHLNDFDLDAMLKTTTDTHRNNLILALLSGLPPLAALMHSLRAFGVNPTRLIALGSGEKGKSAHIDPSARQHFANEFKEVTECLELGRMVIFIDDLDRCSKENVVDILESINFLSVSGDCYIILGMDKGWVEVCIEQQFPEMTDNNHDFANEYLEKLINIEVPVPTLENEGSGKLLAPELPEQESLSLWERFRDWFFGKVSSYRYAILVILLATIGIILGSNIDLFDQETPKHKVAKTFSEIKVWNDVDIEDIDVINGQPRMLLSIGKHTPVEPKTTNAAQDGKQDKHWQLVLKANEEDIKNGVLIGTLGDKSTQAKLLLRLVEEKREGESTNPLRPPKPDPNHKQADKSSPTVELRAGQTDNLKTSYLLPATVLFFTIMGLLTYILRKPDRIVNDSSRFRDALRIWHPWVTLHRQTPRAIKRYLNRVRYIAMRYREETDAEDEQQSVITKLLKSKSEAPEQINTEDESIDESNLVALSAIFAVDESWIIDDEKFKQLHEGKLDVLLREKFPRQFSQKKGSREEIQVAFMKPLENSIMQHQQEFGDLTFTDKEQRKKFLDILAATQVT